jgi:hypothetical protein
MSEIVLPGVYIDVRPEGLISPGQVTIGNLGVIGTASKGPLGVAKVLDSFAEAKETFGPYDAWNNGAAQLTLVRALELAFSFGATTAYAVRLGKDTLGNDPPSASTTLNSTTGPCVTLTAATPGTWGNDLLVNVFTADDQAFVNNENHQGNEPAPIRLKRKPILKSALNHIELQGRRLAILYASTPARPDDDPGAPGLGAVKVNRDTGEMSFGDVVGAADKITASYAVDKASAVKVTFHYLQNQESFNVSDGDNLYDVANDPVTGSKLVKVTKAANSNEKPSPSANADTFQSFKGGDNGIANANLQGGLDILLNEEAHIIVAAGQDDRFGNTLHKHCQLASTDAVKHDRIAVVGSRLGASNDVIRSHNIDSDRVIFVAPGIKAQDNGATPPIQVTLPGAFTAAAVAGLIASFDPEVSLTNKSFGADDLEQYFTQAQLGQLLQSRVLVLEKRQGFRVVRGITTSSGSAFSQITTRRIVDYAKFGVRSAANPFIGLLNNERVRAALRSSINAFLAQMVNDEMLVSYELAVSATREEERQGICRVVMTLRPVFSIDFIKVTMFLE